MSKRRLTLTIDAETETCGACVHVDPGRPGPLSGCALFGGWLFLSDAHENLRGPRCHTAEAEARPWQGSEDDDDPTPHHLQEKP